MLRSATWSGEGGLDERGERSTMGNEEKVVVMMDVRRRSKENGRTKWINFNQTKRTEGKQRKQDEERRYNEMDLVLRAGLLNPFVFNVFVRDE